METQNLLHQRSSEIPEGLYIDLMNKLKVDFDNDKPKKQIIVIHKSIAKTIACTKCELIQQIIKKSVDWTDREEILLNLPLKSYSELKNFCCRRHGLPTMKLNPRWAENEVLIEQNHIQRNELRRGINSPGFFHIN